MSLLGLTSISTLTVLSFERYMMISQPFRNRNLTHIEAIYLIVGIWIYASCLSFAPLFGWGDYVVEAANISCSVNWEEKSFSSMTYIMYLFFFGLLVPISVISFSYVNIIITMKRKAFRMGKVTKAEGKVAFMVFIMIVAFLVAWTPYAILALIIQFGDGSLITPAMGVVPAILAKSSICYNPIIYVGLNSQFRQSWKFELCTGKETNSSACETYDIGISRITPMEDLESKRNKKKALLKSDANNISVERMALSQEATEV